MTAMHVINRLYTGEFDFPRSESKGPTYMIATVPRAGSTHCAIKMWQTGLLGSPMEYLNFPAMAVQIMPRLGVDGARARELSNDEILSYWKLIQERRTSFNGVFGFKMFMVNFADVVKQYPDLLEQIGPDYVIHLRREDLLGQAISYSRAIQTKVWFADVQNAPHPVYDFEHIAKAYRLLVRQYTYWEGVFEKSGINPIRITYEQLLDAPDETIDYILEKMGMSRAVGATLDIPNVRRQTDDLSREWRDRYERETEARRSASVEAA